MNSHSEYPELQQLYTERCDLDRRIKEAMIERFLNKGVRVNHYHGSYTGEVTRVGCDFSLIVTNHVTGKSSQRWPLCGGLGQPDVELIEGGSHD